jgi:hypothetical protein
LPLDFERALDFILLAWEKHSLFKKMHHFRSMGDDEMKRKEDEHRRAPSLFSTTAQSKENTDGEIVLQYHL